MNRNNFSYYSPHIYITLEIDVKELPYLLIRN